MAKRSGNMGTNSFSIRISTLDFPPDHDLTQLTLGLDRNSGTVAHIFDENNLAVRRLIAEAIRAAHLAKKPIGICGQAPSDFPDFAEVTNRLRLADLLFWPML